MSCSKDEKIALVCSQRNINENGLLKCCLWGACLVRFECCVCLDNPESFVKLVQVIDLLWALSLLKESTLSMELLPQPLK